MHTRFAASPDHIRIAYDVSGAGPAVMLLHGGGGSRREWHDGGYVERLKNNFRVIAVDLRGHGESDKPTDLMDYSTEKMGLDLIAVANACGVERFTLWGYSFGGNAGRYLAARSECVEKMVMVGNPLGPGVSGEWRQMAVDFRNRWTSSVLAQAGSTFDPRLLSVADQEEIQRLSFSGELLPVVLAFSSAMLDWGRGHAFRFPLPYLVAIRFREQECDG